MSTITLPSTLKYIGTGVFSGEQGVPAKHTNKVTEVIIPKSVIYIGYHAFGNRYDMNIVLEDGIDTSGYDEEWDIFTDRNLYGHD